MQQELVSVIMPSYNSKYIAASIESILAQSYKEWELLIADDCSTDQTREIVHSYAERDARVKLFALDRNGGAGVARNHAIQEAKGRFIAFCDSDDMWLPQKLEKQVKFMLSNDYDFTFTSYLVQDEENNPKGHVKCKRKINFFDLVQDDCVGCLTSMYDTKRLGKVYLPTFKKRQDWCLWLTIIKMCKHGYGIQEPLARYRKVSNSLSSNKLSLVKYNMRVYTDFLHYPKVVAYFIFFFIFLPTYFSKKLVQRLSAI